MKKTEIENVKLLSKGVKLNFKIFKELNLENEDLEFLHLISSAVLYGNLKSICFYNASFLSTKFSKVSFINCNLKSSDLGSIWVSDSYFQDTDFSNATISDSTFINCSFDGSIFESVSLTKCQFINCSFEQFIIDDSTFSLNTFIRCYIKNTHFTESFYYQIFDNCTFYKVKMNPTLIGFNFGFSSNVLSQLVSKSELRKANDDFVTAKLYINAAILRINQVQNYYDEAMIACVTALGQMIKNNILIKADEIEFMKNLTSYFHENNYIAPISCLQIWQLLNNKIMNIPQNIATTKAMPLIREYANMLYFNFIDFQKELQNHLQQLPPVLNIAETAELEVIYSEKPTSPLLNYLVKFSALVSQNCPMPKLICTKKGSFLEYHEIAIAIIPYLQTFFSFLGIVVPIVIYKKQKQDHEKEKSVKNTTTNTNQKEEIEITVTTQSTDKPSLLLPNTNIITSNTNTVTSDVIRILTSQPMKNGSGFCGYNNHNIQSITISFH